VLPFSVTVIQSAAWIDASPAQRRSHARRLHDQRRRRPGGRLDFSKIARYAAGVNLCFRLLNADLSALPADLVRFAPVRPELLRRLTRHLVTQVQASRLAARHAPVHLDAQQRRGRQRLEVRVGLQQRVRLRDDLALLVRGVPPGVPSACVTIQGTACTSGLEGVVGMV